MKRMFVLMCVLFLLFSAGCQTAKPVPTEPDLPAQPTKAPVASEPTKVSSGAIVAGKDYVGSGVFERYSTMEDYTKATGKTIDKYQEAPILAEQVSAGKLPPVTDRVPQDAMVLLPANEIGVYGGTFMAGRMWVGEWSHEFSFSYAADLKSTAANFYKGYEVNADSTVYTMHLRKGMKWSDGAPVTADDIVMYYNNLLNNKDYEPDGRAEYKTASGMGDCVKVDDYTITFTFKESNSLFPITLSRTYKWIIPWHYAKQFHPDFANSDDLKKMITDAGVPDWQSLFDKKTDYWGSNEVPTIFAYKLVSDSADAIKKLERNPYYWKVDPAGNQLPYIDSVVFEDSMERDVLLVKTIAGEVDYAAGGDLDLTKNYPLIKDSQEKGNYRLIPTIAAAVGMGNIAINYSIKDSELNKLFNDYNFRKALSIGTDRDAINALMFNSLLIPSQWSPSDGPPYNGDSDTFKQNIKYDPDAANAILDSLGLTWNADKTARLRSDGKPLEIVLFATPSESAADFVAMAEIVKSQWEKVLGIQIVVKPIEDSNWGFSSYPSQYDGLYIGAWVMGSEFPSSIGGNENVCPMGQDWPVHGPWSVWLRTDGKEGTAPPADVKQLFGMCQTFKAAQDAASALAIENEITALHAKNMWIIGLLKRPQNFYTNIHVVSNRIGNVPSPLSKEQSYESLESWYVKP